MDNIGEALSMMVEKQRRLRSRMDALQYIQECEEYIDNITCYLKDPNHCNKNESQLKESLTEFRRCRNACRKRLTKAEDEKRRIDALFDVAND